MQIVVAGGHGQVAMLLHPMLASRGHQVRSLIRNPDQPAAGRRRTVLCDLEAENEIAEAVGTLKLDQIEVKSYVGGLVK